MLAGAIKDDVLQPFAGDSWLYVLQPHLVINEYLTSNNTSATATALAGTSGRILGNVFPAADVDFYSITAATGNRFVRISVTMTGLPPARGTSPVMFTVPSALRGALGSGV
jgi:hypothetical protein